MGALPIVQEAIRRAAKGKGMRSLAEDGLQKVAAGLTTVEEVMRASAL